MPGVAPSDLHTFFTTLALPPVAHGGPFRYASANTDLLGWVIERVTGRRFADLLAERLWQPMGAAAAASITLDAAGAARCTGGLSATVRDFARVGQLWVDAGRAGTTQVVPAAWLDDIATAGDAAAWDQGEFAPYFRGLRMHYRSGWYAIDGAPQTLFAMGIHGQQLFVDRENRLVVAKVSSQAEPTDARATGLTLMALEAIRECLAPSQRSLKTLLLADEGRAELTLRARSCARRRDPDLLR